MKQWEIDLRAKLEKELPEGTYEVSGGNLVVWTGKQGKINTEVEFVRAYKNYTKSRVPRKLKKRLKKTYATIDYLKMHWELLKYVSENNPLNKFPEMPLSFLTEGNNLENKTVYEWKLSGDH